MTERFIGGSTGGVPEYVFNPHFGRQEVIGASGAKLLCDVRDRRIEIRSNESVYKFARFFGQITYEGALGLNISNRGLFNNESRHPDIYAAKLVQRFIEFSESMGHPVKIIEGKWLQSGDNTKVFNAHLERIAAEREIVSNDEIEAANKTWTGSLAHRLGFTNTSVVDNGRESHVIWARFHKEL